MAEPLRGRDQERQAGFGNQPLRLSPLHAMHQRLGAQFIVVAGWRVPQIYTSPDDETAAIREGVGIGDLSSLGKLLVRGDTTHEVLRDAFGLGSVAVGSIAEVQTDLSPVGKYAARLAADEFLLITAPGDEAEAAQRIDKKRPAADAFVTTVVQSSGMAGVAVVGSASHKLLSKLCALHLSSVDFPNRRVAQGSVAKVRAIIVRNDCDGIPSFELYVERVYAEYLWSYILDAGVEFGIVPFGWIARQRIENK